MNPEEPLWYWEQLWMLCGEWLWRPCWMVLDVISEVLLILRRPPDFRQGVLKPRRHDLRLHLDQFGEVQWMHTEESQDKWLRIVFSDAHSCPVPSSPRQSADGRAEESKSSSSFSRDKEAVARRAWQTPRPGSGRAAVRHQARMNARQAQSPHRMMEMIFCFWSPEAAQHWESVLLKAAAPYLRSDLKRPALTLPLLQACPSLADEPAVPPNEEHSDSLGVSFWDRTEEGPPPSLCTCMFFPCHGWRLRWLFGRRQGDPGWACVERKDRRFSEAVRRTAEYCSWPAEQQELYCRLYEALLPMLRCLRTAEIRKKRKRGRRSWLLWWGWSWGQKKRRRFSLSEKKTAADSQDVATSPSHLTASTTAPESAVSPTNSNDTNDSKQPPSPPLPAPTPAPPTRLPAAPAGLALRELLPIPLERAKSDHLLRSSASARPEGHPAKTLSQLGVASRKFTASSRSKSKSARAMSLTFNKTPLAPVREEEEQHGLCHIHAAPSGDRSPPSPSPPLSPSPPDLIVASETELLSANLHLSLERLCVQETLLQQQQQQQQRSSYSSQSSLMWYDCVGGVEELPDDRRLGIKGPPACLPEPIPLVDIPDGRQFDVPFVPGGPTAAAPVFGKALQAFQTLRRAHQM
ncbi:unnamed protein product [Vitrella brassicaformis CCMP3155]|uniref:Uncharacterized protein n=2 Tax=Vitrella brassicaformis TaxID=1169539 RepID=A0A0G4F573_VITBC|nr:unnamed protein product [Vitrella brassicaformis CCMP3155]|eukprot:CEM07136.1 unnamed protein product [Vitrella brassicaformis CCMP3155]